MPNIEPNLVLFKRNQERSRKSELAIKRKNMVYEKDSTPFVFEDEGEETPEEGGSETTEEGKETKEEGEEEDVDSE